MSNKSGSARAIDLPGCVGYNQRAVSRRFPIHMHLIGAILIGLIVGVIAKFLTPGRDPGGCFITILIGLAGSFVGTYLGQALGLYQVGEAAGFIGSVIGAVILLLIYRMIFGRRA